VCGNVNHSLISVFLLASVFMHLQGPKNNVTLYPEHNTKNMKVSLVALYKDLQQQTTL